MKKKKVSVWVCKDPDASAEYDVPQEADVLRWFKKDGDSVNEGDELCELEAEKGAWAVKAPASGKLVEIRYPVSPGKLTIWKRQDRVELEGGELCYGPPLCFIEAEETESQPVAPALPDLREDKSKKPKISAEALRLIQALGLSVDEVINFHKGASQIGRKEVLDYFTVYEGTKGFREGAAVSGVKAVPAARERAKELGVDLAGIRGSGPEGEILVSDVEAHSLSRNSDIATCRVSVPRLWRTIAEEMKKSAAIPTADAEMDFDFTGLVLFFGRHRREFPQSLWFPVMAALARILSRDEFVLFNSFWDEEDPERPLVVRENVHLGLSYDKGEPPTVDLAEKRASGERLKILVLREAGKKSLVELLDETKKLLELASAKKVPLHLLSGYTFIFNNIGVLGHERGRSLLAGSASCLVNLGRIDLGSGRGILQIVFDHRVIDGAQTPPFLRALHKEVVERVLPELETLL